MPGAGRPGIKQDQPGIMAALEALVEPAYTRGPDLAVGLDVQESREADRAGLARQFDYRGPAAALFGLSVAVGSQSGREGTTHPDRNAQFEHINATADHPLRADEPVISVDTKKKKLVGNFANGGREWQPKGTPEAVRVHEFPSDAEGKAILYGVYDMARNEAWVSVGRDHDTPAFAVASIRHWWRKIGRRAYPKATTLYITADSGRQQRVSVPRLEAGTSALCRPDPPDHRGELFPARDEQVEQDRAPALLPHHDELARHAADDV